MERDEKLMSSSASPIDPRLTLEELRLEHTALKNELNLYKESAALAADVLGMGIWDYDADADSLLFDENCRSIFGLDTGSEQLRSIADLTTLIHPGDVDRFIAALDARSVGHHVNFRLIMPSGETRWITSAVRTLHATETTTNRLIGIVIDATGTHQAEEKIQHTYQALCRAEKVARISSWKLDLSEGVFQVSEMFFQMTGANPAGAPPTLADLRKMLAPESYERVATAISRCTDTGEPFGIDVTHIRPDGSSFAAHIQGEARRDDKKCIVALNGTVQDLSEREEARIRLAALADNLPNGALYRVERDAHGQDHMLYMSAGFEKLVGVSTARIIEDFGSIMAAIHPDDRAGYIKAKRRALKTGENYDSQFRVCHRDGRLAWIHCRAVPTVRNPDGSSTWDCVMRDITDEHDAAEALIAARDAAEAAERAKSDFLATMSHEIRTPMNAVIGMTRLVQQTDLSFKQRNYLEKIDLSSRALLLIINDILDFSKIEAGMLTLEDTEFTLDGVLDTVSAMTAMRAEEKGLEILYSVASNVPQRMRGDSMRLGQVLTNLISNAVKFTDCGEIIIAVTLAEPPAKGAQIIRFSVRDTGIGLTDAEIGNLFQPFSQADARTARRYGGTGLGLAISRRLVELMGGSIAVESTSGAGSLFYFTIIVRESVAEPSPHGMLTRDQLLLGTRLLIVADNASARSILADMARGFGLIADTAESGEKGLEALRAGVARGAPYAIVLMDSRMPGMDGLEVARQVREDQALSRLPVVLMVTAFGGEEVSQGVARLGLQGVLIKPITGSMMFKALERALMSPAPGASAIAQSRPNDESARSSLTGKRVLVVDDNALSREVAADFLGLAGVVVSTAENGKQAIERLQRETFDAVLMDVHMPVMDGIEATIAIRTRSRWAHLPIVALTAQARAEDQRLVMASGMSAHLAKPIDADELYAVLKRFLSARPPISFESASRGATTPIEGNLDISVLRDRFRGSADRMQRTLEGFRRDFETLPGLLLAAAGAGEISAITERVHAVRGALGYLGASSLEALAGLIEEAGRNGNCNEVSVKVPIFADQFRVLIGEISIAIAELAKSLADPPSLDEPATLIAAAKSFVTNGDYAATSILETLATAVTGTIHAPLAAQILDRFEKGERQSAIYALGKLAEALGSATVAAGD